VRANETTKVERIVLELETPGDSRTMFRPLLDNAVVGENLTAVQAHVLVGEILIASPCPDGPDSLASHPISRRTAPQLLTCVTAS